MLFDAVIYRLGKLGWCVIWDHLSPSLRWSIFHFILTCYLDYWNPFQLVEKGCRATTKAASYPPSQNRGNQWLPTTGREAV